MTEFRPLSSVSFRSVRRGAVALALLSSLLGACSSPSLPSISFSSLFGSGTAAGDANAAAPLVLPMNFECPSVTIRSGASTLSSSADQAEATAANMRYQVGITTTARECKMAAPNVVSIKVGIQGRVILGPQGAPGAVDVPIRYAVVFDGVPQRVAATKLERIQVQVPPGDSNVLFSHVSEGIEFPMPKAAEIDQYVVYIGFDPVAAQDNDRKKPAPRPAKPKRQMSQANG